MTRIAYRLYKLPYIVKIFQAKLIGKITGHADMKTLNAYYQVEDNEKKEAVDQVFDIEIPLLKKA